MFQSLVVMAAQVPIVYIDNSDVGRLIKPLGVKKKRLHGRMKINADELATTFADSSKTDLVPTSKVLKAKNENLDDQSTCKILSVAGSVELMSENIHSGPIYSFKTPKRANQMAKYERSDSARYELRTRINFDDSGSESDFDDSDSEEENIFSGTSNETPTLEARRKTPSKRLACPSEVELYFDAHSGKSSRNETSDRTLQRLKNPRMKPEKLSEALEKHVKKTENASHVQDVVESRAKLCKFHEQFFTKWMFYLCNDYNILLFGLGSKRNLIRSFCEKYLRSRDKLVVNGFFPGLSTKAILTSIIEDIMMSSAGLKNIETQVKEISQHYSKEETTDLFLIIHNIDGMSLRNPFAQNLLSRLSTVPKIHIVASIDHINAPLIWTQTISCLFNWLWYDVTTYAPYDIETSYEGSLLLTGAGAGVSARGAALALSGLLHVARSLTSNARGVFRILAERQIEDKENKENEKIEDLSFFDLYQKCREKFFVNSELTLRAHLTEFVDHKLVQIRTGTDGCDYLSVPLNVETLKDYLEQEETL